MPRHQPAAGQFTDVEVRADPAGRVAGILGESFTVACSHHQSIDRLGTGLVVTARSADAGIIEAVELPGAHFVVGVQWHPEESGDRRLFDAVVEAARAGQR